MPEGKRLAVNLPPAAASDLNWLLEAHGYSQTETVRRALRLYAKVERERQAGGTVWIGRADGTEYELELL